MTLEKERLVIQKNWQELIKPNKVDVGHGSNNTRVGKVVVEPLERGFGLTLGNALRRILMSSLQGAAVTNVQIDGVLHEFSSIEGVREDVIDIVLNIKAIAVRMHVEGPKNMRLHAEGPCEVTAGMIEAGADIEIMNPDLVICTLDKGAKLNMEMTVNTGKGYRPASQNRPEDAPVGLIPVDSIFSPVRKVSYEVEDTRVGQITDYDKLNLSVETNGVISPEDAVAYAARILQDQLQVFINFEEPKEAKASRKRKVCRSTATCSRKSTSWNCRFVLPTASKTTISFTSATWFRNPKAKCCVPLTSVASRSTKSKKFSRSWASTSACRSKAGRLRISKTWPRKWTIHSLTRL